MEELVSRVTRVTKCQDCGAEVEQLSGPLEVCAQACKGCGYPRSVLPADGWRNVSGIHAGWRTTS
jgi:hypothetical protein